jgi:hypothetical protein
MRKRNVYVYFYLKKIFGNFFIIKDIHILFKVMHNQLLDFLNLKSVNLNFTLAVHSTKFGQSQTHFLSHFGEKKRKNMARPGFEPMISRSEVDRASITPLNPY